MRREKTWVTDVKSLAKTPRTQSSCSLCDFAALREASAGFVEVQNFEPLLATMVALKIGDEKSGTVLGEEVRATRRVAPTPFPLSATIGPFYV